MNAHPEKSSSVLAILKSDEPNKLKTQELLGEEFYLYFSPKEMLNDLRFKKIGTTFKLIYVPPQYDGKPILDVSYIMSGYYPNLINIKLLSDLMKLDGGVVNVCFRHKGLGLHYSDSEHINKMEKIVNCNNVFFNVNCSLDPFRQMLLENTTDLVALPYINTSMFEIDNISFNTLKEMLHKTQVPIIIF